MRSDKDCVDKNSDHSQSIELHSPNDVVINENVLVSDQNIEEIEIGDANQQDEKKAEKDDDEKDKKILPIPIYQLFRYGDTIDMFLMIFGIFGAIAAGAIMPSVSIVMGQSINYINNSSSNHEIMKHLSHCGLIFLYLAIGVSFASYLSVAMFMTAAERQAQRVRILYLKGLLRQEMSFHDIRKTGDIAVTLSTQSMKFQDGIGDKFSQIIQQLSSFVTGFIIAFVSGWELSLVIIACLPLLIIAGAIMAIIIDHQNSSEQQADGNAGTIVSESFNGIRTVVGLQTERYNLQRYKNSILVAFRSGIFKGFVQGCGMGVFFLVVMGIYGLSLWYGVRLLQHHVHRWPGKLYTGGTIFTIFYSLIMGAFGLSLAAPHFNTVTTAQVAARPLFDVIERKSRIDPLEENKGIKFVSITGQIDFSNVTFTYPARPEVSILRNLNISFQPGKMTALVGTSGSGKSTVLQLIERFYDPDIVSLGDVDQGGEYQKNVQKMKKDMKNGINSQNEAENNNNDDAGVTAADDDGNNILQPISTDLTLLNNLTYDFSKATYSGDVFVYGVTEENSTNGTITKHNLRDVNIINWRSHIGLVSQEPVLFAGTIKDNLIAGNPLATIDDINKATQAANADTFISKMKDGYDTYITSNLLSGGQKQRVAISKALLKKPSLLLLDEATSALDTESERAVQKSIDKIVSDTSQKRTILSIAHRLSTIKNADRILVFDNGRIIEDGNHQDLIDLNGVYANLVATQDMNGGAGGSGGNGNRNGTNHNSTQENVQQSNNNNNTVDVSTNKIALNNTLTYDDGDKNHVASHTDGVDATDDTADIDDDDDDIHESLIRHNSSFECISTIHAESTHKSLISSDDVAITIESNKLNNDIEDYTVESSTIKNSIKKDNSTDTTTDTTVVVKKYGMGYLLYHYALPIWYIFFPGIILSFVEGAAFPCYSLLMGTMTNLFYDSDNIMHVARLYAGYFVVLGAGAGFVAFLRNCVMQYVGEKIALRVRHELFDHCLRQEIGWYDRGENSPGELESKLSGDTSHIRNIFTQKIPTVFNVISSVFTGFLIALIQGWHLAVILLAVFPLLAFAGLLQFMFMEGFGGKMKGPLQKAIQTAGEAVKNIRTIASFTGELNVVNIFEQQIIKTTSLGLRSAQIAGVSFAVSNFIILAYNGLIYWYGGKLITSHKLTFKNMMQVITAVEASSWTIGQIFIVIPDFEKMIAAINDVFTIINKKSSIDYTSPDGSTPVISKGEIEFDNVFFHYPTRPDVKVLRGLSLIAKSHRTLAIVGESGGGKSTIFSLIQRFYDPVIDSDDKACLGRDCNVMCGTVKLDGYDIKKMNISHLRHHLGIVGQEPVLFSGSIIDNIKCGDDSITDDMVYKACITANIHELITKRFPKGYQTQVGPYGMQLSGGQKQRLCIARALIREPKVLLLDEATSALDSRSERLVQAALEKSMKNRTTLLIAHRLDTLRHAEAIIVIDKGIIVEGPGNHEEMVALNGRYAKLVAAAMLTGGTIEDGEKAEKTIDNIPPTENMTIANINSLDGSSTAPIA